jgi:hypothetical protein
MESRPHGLDQEDHGELGVNDRLLDINNIESLFEKKLRHLRDDSNSILSDHRDNIKILLLA